MTTSLMAILKADACAGFAATSGADVDADANSCAVTGAHMATTKATAMESFRIGLTFGDVNEGMA